MNIHIQEIKIINITKIVNTIHVKLGLSKYWVEPNLNRVWVEIKETQSKLNLCIKNNHTCRWKFYRPFPIHHIGMILFILGLSSHVFVFGFFQQKVSYQLDGVHAY